MTFLGHLAEANEMINAFALGFIKKGITLAQRDSRFLGPSDPESEGSFPPGSAGAGFGLLTSGSWGVGIIAASSSLRWLHWGGLRG